MEERRGGVCRWCNVQKEIFKWRNARVIYVFITTLHNAGTLVQYVSTRSARGAKGSRFKHFSGVSDPIILGLPRGAT
jgi:hypothetical protein